jgi:hypothetical protein
LQEARRQMRMTAADGEILLGSADLHGDPTTWLADRKAGCVVLTAPHTARDAAAMLAADTRDDRNVEALLVDGPLDDSRWCVRSVVLDSAGNASASTIGAEVKAPPSAWRNRWCRAGETTEGAAGTPADWFLDAGEALGDAALAQVTAQPGDIAYIDALEACLRVAPTHEIIHQTLAEGARAMLKPSRRRATQ